MRSPLVLRRPPAAVLVVLALLAGCGGGADEEPSATSSSPSAPSPGSESSPSQDPGAADFCPEAGPAVDELTRTLATSTEQEIADRLPEAVATLEAITAPPAIEADWRALVDALDQLATAATSLDLGTPEGQQQYAEVQAGLSEQVATAQDNVTNYVISNCSTETVAPAS